MNGEDKRKVKIGLLIFGGTLLLYLLVVYTDRFQMAASYVLRVLSPFLYGICFAFVLNIPLNFFEKKIFFAHNRKNSVRWQKRRRSICLFLTAVLFLGILAGTAVYIAPQLAGSAAKLASAVPDAIKSIGEGIDSFFGQLNLTTQMQESLLVPFSELADTFFTFLADSIPQVVQTLFGVTAGIFNGIMGFIISLYLLAMKERLAQNGKNLLYAYCSSMRAEQVLHIAAIANRRFEGFVSGQLTESYLLGLLCFLGMMILRQEYALLIGVTIAVTSLVPIVGPIAGTLAGALILWTVSPMHALWFVIFMVILQQVEGNFIYPKVVGDSIGLPGLWVMFAIITGGKLFGIPGMILGVPIFAVVYSLLAERAKERLVRKKKSPVY